MAKTFHEGCFFYSSVAAALASFRVGALSAAISRKCSSGRAKAASARWIRSNSSSSSSSIASVIVD